MFKSEKEKYLSLYAGNLRDVYVAIDPRGAEDGGYGRGNWGENALPFLLEKGCQILLDYGCGYGRFAQDAVNAGIKALATDIASVETENTVNDNRIAFFSTDGVNITLPSQCVDWVTSFDCLEHVPEENLDKVLNEFNRVSKKGFILSIAYHGDFLGTIPLHMTVKPKDWWIEKLSSYGKVYEWGETPTTKQPYLIIEK